MSCVDAAIIKALAEHIGTVNDSDESSTVFNTINRLCRKEVPHEWGTNSYGALRFKVIPGLNYYGMIVKVGGLEILITGFDPETYEFEHKITGFSWNRKMTIVFSREDQEWCSISIFDHNENKPIIPDVPEPGNVLFYGWSRYEHDGKPAPYATHIYFLHRDLDSAILMLTGEYNRLHGSS